VARIPREIVDEVRSRTDIAEVIGRHVALQRRGRNLVGLCPFHQEKTPSFHVISEKGIFHCFGCQTGGDVFKFLMLVEGLSFLEAVKELAAPLNVTIEERELTATERRALRERATLFDVLEAAAAFYEGELWTRPEGEQARTYLTDRGLTEETSRAARLGWAPAGWSRLLDALHREGYDPALVAEAGLSRPRQHGEGFYDTLRERVVVPIRDERGRVIAFGARLLEGEGPKYLNTPETRLYQKGRVLYGLEIARAAAPQRGQLIVVEGYFDVLSLRQAGFPEAVATCGTALTADHLERLRRLSRDVVVVMDADEAGLRAAERTLPLFVASGVQPWRLELTDAKDPDELVRKVGPEAFARALAGRQPLFEWVLQRKLDAFGTSTLSRDRVLEDVLPMLAQAHDATLVARAARRLGMPEPVVAARVRHSIHAAPAPAARPTAGTEIPPTPSGWEPDRETVHLLWLLVHRYAEVADVLARVGPGVLGVDPVVLPAIARLVSGEPVAAILEESTDTGLRRALGGVVARDRLYEPDEAIRAVLEILVHFARPIRAARLSSLNQEIERCAANAAIDRLKVAAAEKMELLRSNRALDRAVRDGDVRAALDLLATT
jgi:DNA primase